MHAAPTPAKWRVLAFLAILALPVSMLVGGCSTTHANRNPSGEPFPRVEGESLEREPVVIPDDLAGAPAVLLIGYKQSAQFDIDRWLMGLLQADVDAQLVEVPTIPGLMPTIASKWIDDGMRAGIPREDWGAVVTLYGDTAKPVARFTGTENGQLARIVVLDPEGRVVWFTDQGYSARKALDIAERVSAMNAHTNER